MTTKTKSRILEAVHETAGDLHRLGFIDKRKMQKYDALCLEPVQDYDAEKVKALRERLHLSQAVLAGVLNTSTSTIRKWEVGDKRPSGPSQKLLDILDRKGLEAVLWSAHFRPRPLYCYSSDRDGIEPVSVRHHFGSGSTVKR